MSARVRASATASLPEIRSSLSSAAAGTALVATAMSVAPLHRLVLRVLARDARRDLDAARVQVALQLLIVLASEAEAVRAHRGLLVTDLLRHPHVVLVLVLAPHLPLARVVLEDRLVHHGDAVLHGADRLAYAAAAARLHVGAVGAVPHPPQPAPRPLEPTTLTPHTPV